jgi:nitroreductase
MSFLDLAKTRYSVRKFKPDAVEPEKLQSILEAAHVAPTAANRQPQRIIVVQTPEGLAKIAKTADIYAAPLALLVCAERAEAWIRPQDDKNVHQTDAAIVTDHMMLQATQLGLGSLWVAYFNPGAIREDFGLPPTWKPMNILAVGYPDRPPSPPDRHSTTRRPLAETVFYEALPADLSKNDSKEGGQ